MNLLKTALIAVFGLSVTTAVALCPESKKCSKSEDAAVVKASDKAEKPCCAKTKTELASDKSKSGCSKNKEAVLAADTEKKGGCSKSKEAVLASDKAKKGCCSKSKTAATLASDKAGCSKSKEAVLAADSAKKGCCKDKAGATLASDSAQKGCNKNCDKTDCAEKCPMAIASRALDSVFASMPKMTYKVGDKSTCCSKEAQTLATESGTAITYVVGDETFENEGDAVVRLASAIEKEMNSLLSVQFSAGGECTPCPMTARSLAAKNGGKVMYRAAGIDFEAKEKAEEAIKLARAAADEVTMTYKVGDKTIGCCKTAAAMADSGEKVIYVIGDEEIGCKQLAELTLAQTKVRAIVEAAATKL